MKIQINPGDVETSEAIDQRIRDEVEKALRHFAEQVTRVEVHLHDENGPKAGLDKRCKLEVRLAGHDPMMVEHDARDLYEAIHQAADKLERAVRHKLERHDEKHSR